MRCVAADAVRLSPVPGVLYQGAPGAFGEQAARRFAGAQARPIACTSFERLFALVAGRRVRWGVVPIENTLAGPVRPCAMLLRERAVVVVAETEIPIALALIATAPVALSAIRRVYSHPMALAQCRAFLLHHAHLEAVPAYDTAGAARGIVRAGDPSRAAIAAARCAGLYGGTVIVTDVHTSSNNFTRFLLIEAAGRPRDGVAS